ncbi:MAG: hypothetical protein JNJ77_05075, partial [Planctomycetia bacterium]|nr:hypothetical protein [Planctomycetia bacterium]
MHAFRWLLASSCIAAGFSAAQAQGALDSTPSSSIPVQPESIAIAPNSDAAPTPANSNVGDSFCQSRFDSLWNRPTLTGDWNGLRPRLQEQGITIGGNITQFGFGVGGDQSTGSATLCTRRRLRLHGSWRVSSARGPGKIWRYAPGKIADWSAALVG